MRDRIAAGLTSIVGATDVLVDSDLRSTYETDWTGRFSGTCTAVVRTSSTREVAEVVRFCNSESVDIIAQGGNTGLVGGGVPRSSSDRPSIVLSLCRMNSIRDLDTAAAQVTAEAGTTLSEWRDHARASGLDTPVDFAARDSATIGGAIATNAGGSRVLRYGTMRQQVLGIEAVLGNGEVVGSLSGLPKETVGLNWPSVLAGSEGTAAIVTSARLRLVPRYDQTITAMVSVANIGAAVELLGHLRKSVSSLDAVEVIEPAAMDLVAEHLNIEQPVRAPQGGTYMLIDCADHGDPSSELADAMAAANGIIDTAITTDGPPRERLLAFRDRITEAIATRAQQIGRPPLKLDVAVPLDALGKLLEVAQNAADDDEALLVPFGHLAEGNIHLNYLGATNLDQVTETVLTKVAELGGTISAEHGIGIAKPRWLHLIRSPGDLAAQRAVRRVLDPNGILNPGVLTPDA